MLPCNVCRDPVNSRTNYSPSECRILPVAHMPPVMGKKGIVFFSWTVLLLLINCFLPQQACQDNHVKGLTLNLPIERTYEIFRNIIIYSTTIITYLPCWKVVFFILSKKNDVSDRNILWARSSQLHHMDLVLKTIYSTTVSVWMCFFLFRYSENWVV